MVEALLASRVKARPVAVIGNAHRLPGQANLLPCLRLAMVKDFSRVEDLDTNRTLPADVNAISAPILYEPRINNAVISLRSFFGIDDSLKLRVLDDATFGE